MTDDEPRAGRAILVLTTAGIAALLLGATAMSWLSDDGRRLRSREPYREDAARQHNR